MTAAHKVSIARKPISMVEKQPIKRLQFRDVQKDFDTLKYQFNIPFLR